MDEVHPRAEPGQEHRSAPRPPQPAPRRRSWKPILWLGLLVLVVAAVVWRIETRTKTTAPTGRFNVTGPMPVVEAAAQAGDIRVIYNALGTVTALATVTVQTQIAGQLVDVAFEEGQEVKKGDVLAQIDPRPYQAALDQAMGQLARDQAALNEARIDLDRYQKLAAQNSIARQQAEDQEYVVHQDEGTVKLDQAMVDNAKLNLGYCRIVSPITGRIGLRQVDQGNYVQVANATGIAVIAQMKPISVLFTLPEDELPAVMKRLHAGASLAVTAYDRSGKTKLADGTLAAVDSAIDPTTGTVKLRAQFANDDESLFPNQFVNAELLIDTLKNATVVPTAAVQRGQPGTFVYLVKPDDTVSVQKIKLGPQDGERVAVTTGLSAGDNVVTDGADKLRDGAKVSLRQESGAPAAAATPAAGARPGQSVQPTQLPGQPTQPPGQPPQPQEKRKPQQGGNRQ